MMRIIREEEPPKPSTRLSTIATLASVAANRHVEPRRLSALVRGELDWIVMKALEKDRSRRYETASAFARDIERYLDNEPVEASPPSHLYRLGKLAQQYRSIVGVSTLIFAVLVAATGISLWYAARAKAAQTVADQEREKAESANRRAEERADLALCVITSMYEDIAWLAETPGLDDVRRAYVTRAVGLFEQLEADKGESTEVRYYRGELSRQLARLYQDWGRYEEAHRYASQAVELFSSNLRSPEPQIETHLPLARAVSQLGYVELLSGDLDGSAAENDRALEICERLAALYPDNLDVCRQLRIVLENQASTLGFQGHERRREASRRRVLELSERLAAAQPNNSEFVCGLAAARHNLAVALQFSGEGELARELLQLAVESQRRALTLDPNSKDSRRFLANHYHQLGRVESELFDQPSQAVEWYLMELEQRRALANDFPREVAFALDLANCYNSLANVHLQTQNAATALATYQQAVELLEELKVDFSQNVRVQRLHAATLGNVGLALHNAGQPTPALAVFDRALSELYSAEQPQDQDSLATVLNWKSITQWKLGELDDAIDTEIMAVQRRRESVQQHPDNVSHISQLGAELHNLARLYVARESCQRAISLLEEARKHQQRAHTAEPNQARFRDRLRSHLSYLAFCMTLVHDSQQDVSQAEGYARQALEFDARDAASWQSLGMAQYRTGQWQSAAESLEKSVELSHQGDGFLCFFLAMSYFQLNQEAAAKVWFDRGVAEMPQEERYVTQLSRLCQETSELTGFTVESGSVASEPRTGE